VSGRLSRQEFCCKARLIGKVPDSANSADFRGALYLGTKAMCFAVGAKAAADLRLPG
jgi:hypothetical protein